MDGALRLSQGKGFLTEGTKYMCIEYKIVNGYEFLKSDMTNLGYKLDQFSNNVH